MADIVHSLPAVRAQAENKSRQQAGFDAATRIYEARARVLEAAATLAKAHALLVAEEAAFKEFFLRSKTKGSDHG